MTAWLFDGFLAAGLLWLGWRTVANPDPFKAVLLFIAFGLLMALCWARLVAPDVALAEAAIGAGLTGALLLDACRSLQSSAPRRQGDSVAQGQGSTASGVLPGLLALLSISLTGGLAWVLLTLPEPAVDLSMQVRSRLAESGVSNPVTAVLLNFRAYDTLLEVAVLLLALIGVGVVNAGEADTPEPSVLLRNSPLLDSLTRLLVPVAVLTALYLLWAGAHAPGGAFQAAAVLAGIGVLLCLGDRLQPAPLAALSWRVLPVLGLAVFSSIALGVMAWGGDLLEYPLPWAGALILAIESCLMVSIALMLALLFSGAPGLRKVKP